MPYLTPTHLAELTASDLAGTQVLVTRGDAQAIYTLVESKSHGMKGVVWRAKDDVGHDVALKFIPADDYYGKSLLDEMTEAVQLGSELFASIKFFGDATFPAERVTTAYKCIATEWLHGIPLDQYLKTSAVTVRDFELLAKHLFGALATLERFALCHEDLHPGNVLLEESIDALTGEKRLLVKVIDTGTIKRRTTRERLLSRWEADLATLRSGGADPESIRALEGFVQWKRPDDHLRIVECLLHAVNALIANYYRLDFWERRFIDQLQPYLDRLVDSDRNRRLDEPKRAYDELRAQVRSSRTVDSGSAITMASPFDYISAEMIQTDSEFFSLFSSECPWLSDCIALQPLYIYGPRGCGKSSVLRWLSFKVQATDKSSDFASFGDVGIYISCSVELRSRFWLFSEDAIEQLQTPIIRYFALLLLEELFDTTALMVHLQKSELFDFDIDHAALDRFAEWFVARLDASIGPVYLRLRGQDQFTFLRGLCRKLRWDCWSAIQRRDPGQNLPDPSLIADVCRSLTDAIGYLVPRHVTFLLDDYSNQRIPSALQRKLNQTISFAKQGTPIFKVSSEYNGVDLTGIQEGREVSEINVGERYTSLPDSDDGVRFLVDILNKRLAKAGFASTIETLLGHWDLDTTIQRAIRDAAESKRPFYYHGIEAVHLLCSGDLALALDLVRKVFDTASVTDETTEMASGKVQHRTIKNFANDELRRIKYIVPFGPELYEIVAYLGSISRAFVIGKDTAKKDRAPEPVCKTHLDVRPIALRALRSEPKLSEMYGLLTSRAILITLESSRSRIEGLTERLQLRRIYLPAFQAPLKRDVPIKVDSPDELVSLLTNPATFAERELRKSDIDTAQLRLALLEIEVLDGTVST